MFCFCFGDDEICLLHLFVQPVPKSQVEKALRNGTPIRNGHRVMLDLTSTHTTLNAKLHVCRAGSPVQIPSLQTVLMDVGAGQDFAFVGYELCMLLIVKEGLRIQAQLAINSKYLLLA